MSETAKSGLDALNEKMLTAAQAVLGSMLIDEAAVGPMLMQVDEGDFLYQEHRNLFRAMKELYGHGKPIDAVLINEHLGGDYGKRILELMEMTPTAANADLYAQELKKAGRLWQLRQIGLELNQAEDGETCRELIDRANLLLCQRVGVRRVTMEQGYREFFQRHSQVKPPDYLKWNLGDLNANLHVGPGDMVVIGGYPSAGKTAIALQFAFQFARTKRVGFFSYETSADKLHDRMVACQTQTSFSRMMSGKLEYDDYSRVKDMREHLTGPTMDLLETAGMTVSGIGSYAMAHHYDVIVVDYLQKIPAARTGRPINDFERVSQVSSDLQQLGRRTGKTIIALSQLSRAEKRKDGTIPAPDMSDLRQSGQIEQDADVILLLWKEYPEAAASKRFFRAVKNKDGESMLNMLLDFDGDKQCFSKSNAQPAPGPAPEPPVQQSIFRPVRSVGATPFDTAKEKTT